MIGVAVNAAALIAVIVLVIVLKKDPLVGTWLYSDGTKYRFGNDNTGAMVLDDYDFKYTYTARDGRITIDYERDEVQDAEYTYEVDGDKLTLHGGQGTAGGDYDLSRVE